MKEEKVLTDAVLCYLVKNDKVLLARKAKKIGEGCWSGYGGGIDGHETELQAVIRETKEEGHLTLSEKFLEKVAIIDFHNTKSDGKIFICKVHVYLATKWSGEPKETEEMLSPTWFDRDHLPFDEMMPSDKEWFPQLLTGQKLIAKAYLGPFQKTSLGETEITYVKGF
ncbi:MAG: NUDIX domain-containing protein [Parcubacteria group bacterium]|jgi:ADP-ribose pyrophosphatase YjhB (NUDIX family)